jgi:hypothetical protein
MSERATTTTTPEGRPEPELLSPGLVHELRQPLTGLDAGLKLVARELGPAVTALDAWRIATDQLTRLRETLETYQQLMTPGATEAAAFPVEPVVRRAVAGLRHRLDALPDRFSLAFDRDVPHAWGAPHALHHAVANLLANALDAVDASGSTGRIAVRVARAPGELPRAQVRVADEGTGVSAGARERLFTPRFTTKAPGKGSGLGLAVARRMLRASGGEVRLGAACDPERPPWARTEFLVDLAAGPDAPAPLDAPPPPAGPRLRLRLRLAWPAAASLLALVLAIGGGWGLFQRWVRAGDAPPALTAAPVRPAADRVELVSAAGVVERLRGGTWEPVAPGERLRDDDTLRAGPGARATIAIGDTSRLSISDATQLTVREITAAVQRLRLTRGRISVDHQADGARVLVVESEHGEQVAPAGAARFSVLANGAALAVATDAGVVRLKASGRTVDVAAGEHSVSFRGAAPSAPAPIPVALLLKIARAATERDGACRVEGHAAPGAEVTVGGEPVQPGAGGFFSVRVAVAAGARHATLVTRDAAGRVVEQRVACARARESELSDFAVRWGQQ